MAGLLKTANAAVIEDAVAAEVGVAMDEAKDGMTDVAMDAIAERSRVCLGPRRRALLLLFLLPLVPANQAERSSLALPLDTSRYCFPESRFPSTGAWRTRRQHTSGRPARPKQSQSQLPMWRL